MVRIFERRGILPSVAVFITCGVLVSACSAAGESNEQAQSVRGYEGGDSAVSSEALPTGSMTELPHDILIPKNEGAPATTEAEYIKVKSERYLFLDECLQDKGWPEQIVHDAFRSKVSVTLQGWESDPTRFASDVETCYEAYGPSPAPPALTRDIAAEGWERQMKARDCLKEKGFSLPDPPSREAYVDAHMRGEPTGTIELDIRKNEELSSLGSAWAYEQCPW